MVALGIKALLAVVGIGTVALVASGASADSGKPKPVPKNPDPTATMSPALIAKVNASLLSADPALMRATAKEVAAAGFPEQAASLTQAAQVVEAAIAAAAQAAQKPTTAIGAIAAQAQNTTPLQSTGLPQIVFNPTPADTSPFPVPSLPANAPNFPTIQFPNVTIPGNNVGSQLPTTTNEQRLAGRCALDLATAPVGKEDQTLVKAYQLQEKARGFYVGNIDGLYGPSSAMAFAKDQRIIPPKPRRWPKKNTEAAKTEYRRLLLEMALQDPSRAEEWVSAAKV